MERFAKIVAFRKTLHLDVWQGSEYASGEVVRES